MKRPLKVVVAGYIIGFPMGGMVWFALNPLLALKRMGHEVMFIEDSATWLYPYNPVTLDYSTDSSYGRAMLDRVFDRYGLSGRWAYHSELEGKYYGWSREDLLRYLSEADLLINISGILPTREEYFRPRVKAYLETDPVFSQIKATQDAYVLENMKAHDFHFTMGYNLPKGETPVPLLGFDWKPYLPPVLFDEWTPRPGPGRRYTTIGTWEVRDRDLVLDGYRYTWRKAFYYDQLFDLPKRVNPSVQFEVAYGENRATARFLAGDWIVTDNMRISRDPWGYQDWISESRAEFTVAKEMNVKLKSGWFSDRAACYLAAGRPVINQDCGYDRFLPVGEGLFPFETMDDILDAVERIEADYDRHRRAARRLAEEYFDADKVMTGILREMDLA